MSDTPENIMMIGPSRAGKTSLLSVLRLASANCLHDNSRVEIDPVNDNAKQLFRKARDIVRTGNIVHEPTYSLLEYVFNLKCDVEKVVVKEVVEEEPGPFPWSKPKQVKRTVEVKVTVKKDFTLTVLDGKGGSVFGPPDEGDPAEYARQRAEYVNLARKSVALVICMNANDPSTTADFFTDLQQFLDDVRVGSTPCPFERVAIAVTQADRQVEQFGSSALDRLEALDPAQSAAETMGRHARDGLFKALRPQARQMVYAGWTSVYGFIELEGSVNFDATTGQMVIFRDDTAKWVDNWYPYGVVEPFLFACSGRVVKMHPLRHKI